MLFVCSNRPTGGGLCAWSSAQAAAPVSARSELWKERVTRLSRSELAVLASNERMVYCGIRGDTDEASRDLEDAVAPAEEERAHQLAIEALN
jgi:hypothetical protein